MLTEIVSHFLTAVRPEMRYRVRCLLIVGVILSSAGRAQSQLRIVDYNSTGVNNTNALATIFAAIGDKSVNGVTKPTDVLILQEQDSVSGDTQAIVNILNGLYGSGSYARSTVNGATLGAGRPTLVYNTQTVSLIGELQIGTTSTSGPSRAPMRYQLRPMGYDAASDFYVYASHYNSSSSSRRLAEAQLVRANANAVGQGAHIIHAGDFNIDSSGEAMYQHLLSAGNAQFFDPINSPGSWHESASFKGIHTQNPAGTGFVGGGMDDRFDFQIVTGELMDNEGISYLAGSYHAFANNNTHTFNGHINTGTAASPTVLNALGQASDHLPVVAQYQVPAKLSVSLATVPAQVLVGGTVNAQVNVANSAGDGIVVVSSIGADELDYGIQATGAASGSATATDQAFGSGNSHSFQLGTTSAGVKSATFQVVATSPQVPNPNQLLIANYSVLDHTNASFASGTDTNTLLLDFGTMNLGSNAELGFSIFNLMSTLGFTAPLDLLSVIGTGDTNTLTMNVVPFENLTAGSNLDFVAMFDTSAAGVFSAGYTFMVSDDTALLGAALGQQLTLQLHGIVASSVAGDFDLDGDVDGADFVAWQTNFPLSSGATLAMGDADRDGDVDGADFVIWQTNFPYSPAPAASRVPEPASVFMLSTCATLMSLWRTCRFKIKLVRGVSDFPDRTSCLC